MPENAKKILSMNMLLSVVKWIVVAVSVTATILVFYFTRESAQTEAITKVTTTLSEHVKAADKTFGEIDRTMLEQRTINERTSTALVNLTAEQRALKEENGRLSQSVNTRP